MNIINWLFKTFLPYAWAKEENRRNMSRWKDACATARLYGNVPPPPPHQIILRP